MPSIAIPYSCFFSSVAAAPMLDLVCVCVCVCVYARVRQARLVHRGTGERNFHSFYFLVRGDTAIGSPLKTTTVMALHPRLLQEARRHRQRLGVYHGLPVTTHSWRGLRRSLTPKGKHGIGVECARCDSNLFVRKCCVLTMSQKAFANGRAPAGDARHDCRGDYARRAGA